MTVLPSGTITFLFSDIEDSSGHWERDAERMRPALAAHDERIDAAVTAHEGVVVKHTGDGCYAVFRTAAAAAAAAVDFLRRHQAAADEPALRVRIGLHTGEADATDDNYFGPTVNRAARVMDLANGNQIVCSEATAALLTDLPLRSEGPHELRGIGVEEVFLVVADGLAVDPRPLRRPARPSNLPRTQDSFVGRERELDATARFVAEGTPVVTLVGPGGVGKTRLAVEVGARSLDSFRGRLHFADLVPLSDPGDVVELVAEVVGARRQPGMDLAASIADYLTDRGALILLDNCEHVIDAVRDLVGRLGQVEGVQFVATSREALGLPGEQQVLVAPLSAERDGVELFVDRARQRDLGFELTAANRDAVGEVVRRLDGIPLAIELAAAQIRVLGPAELADRLRDGVAFLGGKAHAPRHETLRDTVRWSFALLTEAEAALFLRLSVFAGGFSLPAAEAVGTDAEGLVTADQVPELLLGLVDKSMVVSTEDDGRRRFSLLETLRAFAAEELDADGSATALRRRHADHFRALAVHQDVRLYSAAEPDAWRELDREWSNLRAAFDSYRAAGDLDAAAELVVSLVWFASYSLRFELVGWAEDLLEEPGIAGHAAYADLCGAAALGAYFVVQDEVTAWAEAGLAADPTDPRGFCRTALASVFLNNVHSAEDSDGLTADWLRSGPTAPGSRLWAEGFRTFHLCTHAPDPSAATHAEEVGRIARETGSTTARILAAWANGMVIALEDIDEAVRVWRDGLEWSRSLPGPHIGEQLLLGLILHTTVRRGDLRQSLDGCLEALRGALDNHYYVGASHLFGVTAIALCRAGDAVTGARLVGAMIDHGHLPRRNARRTLEDALGDDLERELALGRALSITQAGQVAIEALDAAVIALDEREGAAR